MFRCLILLACAPLLAAPPDDVRAVLTRSQEAWNKGDLAAFASYYEDSPQTTYVGRSTVRGGTSAILERYRTTYPTREKMGTLAFSNIEVRMLGSSYALVTGEFHLERGTDAGGNAAGRYTLVLRKTRAGWKIIHDHTS
ncbi:MAG: SgcJ/EcaC family oxidoreductase [Bryobacteraceae bacterium]